MFLVTNIIYSLSDSYWTYDSNNCYNIKVEIKDKTSLKYTVKYKIFYELMVTQFLFCFVHPSYNLNQIIFSWISTFLRKLNMENHMGQTHREKEL